MSPFRPRPTGLIDPFGLCDDEILLGGFFIDEPRSSPPKWWSRRQSIFVNSSSGCEFGFPVNCASCHCPEVLVDGTREMVVTPCEERDAVVGGTAGIVGGAALVGTSGLILAGLLSGPPGWVALGIGAVASLGGVCLGADQIGTGIAAISEGVPVETSFNRELLQGQLGLDPTEASIAECGTNLAVGLAQGLAAANAARAFAGEASPGATSPCQATTLWRVIGQSELDDIRNTSGVIRCDPTGRGYQLEKLFVTCEADAHSQAKLLGSAQNPKWVLSVKIPKEALNRCTRLKPAGEPPTISVPAEELPKCRNPNVLDYCKRPPAP